MYKKKLWKPVLAGTLVLAMALTPLGNASIVSAVEPTETSNKVNAELTTTDDVTDVTTEDNTEAATESDSADSSSSTECSEDTTEDMDAESTDAVGETATEESEKAETPESIQEEESDVNTAENIPLTAAYFPDANFRTYISKNIDANKDGVLSQAERDACTEIDISPHTGVPGPIKSLEGIQLFTYLKVLSYHNYESGTENPTKDPLTKIDLSKNTELIEVFIINTNLEALDVSKNKKLIKLSCDNNNLTSLDVTNNTELTELSCGYNQIKSLDVSKNTKLKELYTWECPLTSLDVSKNVLLYELTCTGLSSIDVKNNPKLVWLNVMNGTIKTLDLRNNPLIQTVDCSNNQLTNLDIGSHAELMSINCANNQLKQLDVSDCPRLAQLNCNNNHLAYIYFVPKLEDPHFPVGMSVSGNVYPVKLNAKRQLDLSTISGFETERVSNLNGGTISGTILTFKSGVNKVTYSYDCGYSSQTFTIMDISQTEAFCTRLYKLCLGRAADASGVNYWTEQLIDKKQTGASLGYNFVFSNEYKKKNTSDEAYVKMLYKVFMDREADKGGLNYWLDLLNQGMSREYVYKGFAESKEFTNICASYGIERGSVKLTQARDQNVNLTKFVNRIYVKAMNRKGDASGLNHWCNQILTKKMTPVQVAESFIYSKEFTDKNLSNTEYIKVLYRTFMGREADSAGLNYWLGRLNKGDSRKTVLKAFAGCQEFKNIVKSFGL